MAQLSMPMPGAVLLVIAAPGLNVPLRTEWASPRPVMPACSPTY
jgi:alpha-D-ribose 1-methylphosphonate 5-triphosphate synthase subunit PhnH